MSLGCCVVGSCFEWDGELTTKNPQKRLWVPRSNTTSKESCTLEARPFEQVAPPTFAHSGLGYPQLLNYSALSPQRLSVKFIKSCSITSK